MRIFSKISPLVLIIAFSANMGFASESIYDRDLVRGFLTLKGDFRSMKSSGVKFINEVTKESYNKEYVDGHVEIGAAYNQMLTWFDIDFMPRTPTRGETEWFAYGATWMWGYKLLSGPTGFNIIPSIGPGFDLMNIRKNSLDDDNTIIITNDRITSAFGVTLNLELEFRVQASQFSAGLYGGYKIVRYDGFTENSQKTWPYGGEVNADRVFGGLKFTWTMLNNIQKRERDLP